MAPLHRPISAESLPQRGRARFSWVCVFRTRALDRIVPSRQAVSDQRSLTCFHWIGTIKDRIRLEGRSMKLARRGAHAISIAALLLIIQPGLPEEPQNPERTSERPGRSRTVKPLVMGRHYAVSSMMPQ